MYVALLLQNVTLNNGRLFYTPEDGMLRLLQPADVVTLDGVQTKYIAINGQIPGPTIEVPLGSEVCSRVHSILPHSYQKLVR